MSSLLLLYQDEACETRFAPIEFYPEQTPEDPNDDIGIEMLDIFERPNTNNYEIISIYSYGNGEIRFRSYYGWGDRHTITEAGEHLLKVNSSRNPDRHVLLNVYDLALLQATEGKLSFRYRETEYIDGYFPSISASDALSGDIDIKQAYVKNNGSQVSTSGYVRFKNQGGVEVEYFEGSLDGETWSSRIELPDIAPGEVVEFSVRRVIAGGQDVAINGYKAWQTFYVGDSRYSGGYEFYITYQVGIAIREMDFREYNVKYRCMIEDVEIPISSFSATLKDEDRSYLSVQARGDFDLSVVDLNNTIKVFRSFEDAAGNVIENEIARAVIDSAPIPQIGPESTSVNIQGHYVYEFNSTRQEIITDKLMYRSIDSEGRVIVRLQANNYIKPGNDFRIDGRLGKIDQVQMNITTTSSTCELRLTGLQLPGRSNG